MPYNKTLEEGLKEFDEMCRHPEYTDVVTATRPEIKSFLTTFAEKIREGVVGEIEVMKKKLRDNIDPQWALETEDKIDVLDDLLAQLKKI